LKSSARKELERLSPNLIQRVFPKLEALEAKSPPRRLKETQGRPGSLAHPHRRLPGGLLDQRRKAAGFHRTNSPPQRSLRRLAAKTSQVRGLLLLAIAAIVFAILRAGVHHVFTIGWWRLW